MKYLSLIVVSFLILAACAQPERESAAKELAEQLKEKAAESPQPTETPEEAPKQETPEQPAETTEQTETPEQAQTQVTIPEQPVTETLKEAEAMEETVSAAKERTRMYRFLDTFAEKVTSYQFEYKGDNYYAKGTRYKVILHSPTIVKDVTFGDTKKSLFYYDTIYVDRSTKKAIAYCEGHDGQVNTQCAQRELYDLAYPVPFQEYNITLPEDWLFSYLDKEPDTWDDNKYYINSRASITVTFHGDPELELDFDPGSGLVLRADQKLGNQLVKRDDYIDLATNLVRDVDVNHRSKSEIPSSESFYK